MSAFRRSSGVSLLGLCWVLMGLWRLGAACPASCFCSGTRIACVEQERGIMAFPVLQSELEMDNITDIYIANQSSFSSINDKDLHYYRNLTNLTVTNSRLTYVSRLAFQNNLKLQYLGSHGNSEPIQGQVSELHLYNLSSLDNNCKITCSAENIVGENESSVFLDILFPPNISKLSDAYSDHHWCIPFSLSGNPKPELRWLLNGEPVNEGPYIMTMIHDFSEREYHGCLQLDSPTHINNGPYTLLASNKYGQDRKTVYVVVGIVAVAFVGFLLMLVILKFGGNSKFGIKDGNEGIVFGCLLALYSSTP
ncbi:unnamed protein product, partial [Coregonus sp. 'balchen']